jgi:Reverse transcriptase (RNA-dependent DNA polymerase)
MTVGTTMGRAVPDASDIGVAGRIWSWRQARSAAKQKIESYSDYVEPIGDLSYPALDALLPDSFEDKAELLDVARHGHKFSLKEDAIVRSSDTRDHRSLTAHTDKWLAQFEDEKANGWLIPWTDSSRKPLHVIATGSVEKDELLGTRRFTRDFSSPHDGSSVNDQLKPRDFRYSSIGDVHRLIQKGWFGATVDIAHAYRSIGVARQFWEWQGLRHPDGKLYLDTRLNFGSRDAPARFHMLTRAVVCIMKSLGFTVVGYVDDFCVLARTLSECTRGYRILIELLRTLGFTVNESKCSAPGTRFRFLGFVVDTLRWKTSLPRDKLAKTRRKIRGCLDAKSVPATVFRSMVGTVVHAARVIRGGRTFARRLLDANPRPGNNRRVPITGAIRADLHWWGRYMKQWNGVTPIDRGGSKILHIVGDACNYGGAAFFAGESIYWAWSKEQRKWHINVKELYCAVLALRTWGGVLKYQRVRILSDNTYTVLALENLTTRVPQAMVWLREMFWLCARLHIALSARHLPGYQNLLADQGSRFDWGLFLASFYSWLDFVAEGLRPSDGPASLDAILAPHRAESTGPHSTEHSAGVDGGAAMASSRQFSPAHDTGSGASSLVPSPTLAAYAGKPASSRGGTYMLSLVRCEFGDGGSARVISVDYDSLAQLSQNPGVLDPRLGATWFPAGAVRATPRTAHVMAGSQDPARDWSRPADPALGVSGPASLWPG